MKEKLQKTKVASESTSSVGAMGLSQKNFTKKKSTVSSSKNIDDTASEYSEKRSMTNT